MEPESFCSPAGSGKLEQSVTVGVVGSAGTTLAPAAGPGSTPRWRTWSRRPVAPGRDDRPVGPVRGPRRPLGGGRGRFVLAVQEAGGPDPGCGGEELL